MAFLVVTPATERWGRLFVSVNYAMRTGESRPAPAKPGVRAGVDLGLRTLATVADTEGNIAEIPDPSPLRTSLAERRRAARQLSRRLPSSRGHERAKAKLARMDRRAVHLRRETWHKLTTNLAAVYGEVVVEDLDLASMKKAMGRRAFRRSVSDAALGMFRPMLTYKAEPVRGRVIVADRWYASSQIHHGCGCRLHGSTRIARVLVCQVSGQKVDRDRNAALNLRDWPESRIAVASRGPVGTTAPAVSGPALGNSGDAGSDAATRRRRRSDCKTRPQGTAGRDEARTQTPQGDAG